MKSASRNALMGGAVLSSVFCLATPVAAQKDEGAAAVAQEDEAAALAARAAALYEAGKYSEAIPLAQQVLAIRERQLGSDHPDVVKAINDLAVAYEGQGRYVDAEPLYQRALAIREDALGPYHLDVAESLAKLGRLYLLRGRIADAESVLGQARAIFEQARGHYQPEQLAFVLKNLARLSQLKQKSQQYQRRVPKSLHYRAGAAA